MSFLAPLLHKSAKTCVLRNRRSGATLATHILRAFDSEERRRGLLGRTHLDPGTAMILAPCAGVHTFFMRFAIDVVFVRRDGTTLKTCLRLRPWRAAFAWGAFAAIEFSAGEAAAIEAGDPLVIEHTA